MNSMSISKMVQHAENEASQTEAESNYSSEVAEGHLVRPNE